MLLNKSLGPKSLCLYALYRDTPQAICNWIFYRVLLTGCQLDFTVDIIVSSGLEDCVTRGTHYTEVDNQVTGSAKTTPDRFLLPTVILISIVSSSTPLSVSNFCILQMAKSVPQITRSHQNLGKQPAGFLDTRRLEKLHLLNDLTLRSN